MDEEKQSDSVDADPPFPEPDPFAGKLNDVSPGMPEELLGQLPPGMKFLGELPVESVAALKKAAASGLPTGGPEAEKLLREIIGDEQFGHLEVMLRDLAQQAASPDRDPEEIAKDWALTKRAMNRAKTRIDDLVAQGHRQQVRVMAHHNWTINLGILREMRLKGLEMHDEEDASHILSHILDAFFGAVMTAVALNYSLEEIKEPFHDASLAIPETCEHFSAGHHVLCYVLGVDEGLEKELVGQYLAVDMAGMMSLLTSDHVPQDWTERLDDLFDQLIERDFTFAHAKDR